MGSALNNNPVALVTGAAKGLGRRIAEALVAAGYRVALLDVLAGALEQTVQDLKASGATVIGIPTDVTDPEQVETAVAQTEQELGAITVLVNNAGTFSTIGPLWESDPETWFRDIRVNLYGGFLVCRSVVGRMVERRAGYVINMVSSGGVLDPHPYGTSYASSKTGMMRLTEGLAKETEDLGIKVFAVGPPAVLTDMTRFLLEDAGAKKWRPLIGEIFERGEDYPPEIVSDLVLTLLSGRADKLSGRYFLPHHDYENMLANAEDIVEKDLWTLRIRGHQPKRQEN